MQKIGKIHLYAGLFFAPVLLYLALSGSWMSLKLHRSMKDGSYQAPVILQEISEIHLNQRYPAYDLEKKKPRKPSRALQWLFVFAGIGLALLAVLGVIMGFRHIRDRKIPALLVITGLLLPVLFLVLS